MFYMILVLETQNIQCFNSNHRMYRSKQTIISLSLSLTHTERVCGNSAPYNFHVMFTCLVEVVVFLFVTQSVCVKHNKKGIQPSSTVVNYSREVHKQIVTGESSTSAACFLPLWRDRHCQFKMIPSLWKADTDDLKDTDISP